MQIIGYILIIFAVADFGLSYMGINLTPFLPNQIATFSPIIIGGIGYFLVSTNFSNFGTNDDVPERYKDKKKNKK
tara:strand:- start:332 stop:556 length:225 start_codon:yes stop_codon:yes gene_type:complete